MNLCGKTVLITGGARRAGAAVVRLLAASGCRILLHCHRSAEDATDLLRGLPGTGHRLLRADFSIPGEVEQLLERVGRCELLVNNASIFFRPGSAEDLAGDVLYEQVNFRAPVALLSWFCAQEPAACAAVNILDQAVLSPGTGGYWYSRKQLFDLTLRLAREWGTRGVRVNAVAPGPMLPPAWCPDSRMEKTLATLPLRRRVEPDDFAAAVKFLLECDSITGAVLPVDCGQHLTGM